MNTELFSKKVEDGKLHSTPFSVGIPRLVNVSSVKSVFNTVHSIWQMCFQYLRNILQSDKS